MRVIVTGGRAFMDRSLMFGTLDSFHSQKTITAIIHGNATGADRLSGEWAASRGVEVVVCQPEWKKFGKSAGPIRNRKMLNESPDLLIAFPGGKGTEDMKRVAELVGLKTEIIEPM